MTTDIATKLSDDRSSRVRLLSDARSLLKTGPAAFERVSAQALIVLCYAHWEGYFNSCVDAYVECVNSLNQPLISVNPALLSCQIDSILDSLRDRGAKPQQRPAFARDVLSKTADTQVTGNTRLLKAASNLDFERLCVCLDAMQIGIERFQPHRNFINFELVRWRHQVAHGDEPDLSSADLNAHSHRTEELLLILKEVFEDSISDLIRRFLKA